MAGNNDRIYSFNPVYRNGLGPAKFYSFERVNGQFINRQVLIVAGEGPAALDHQGHIVPQNILNQVLDATMAFMMANCPDAASAAYYVTHNAPWMADTYNYGLMLGLNMFDYDEDDAEDRFGTYFSIVTWNPINLCRAPSDDRRGGYPGNTIDLQVVNYLTAHPVEQGVDADWLNSLNTLIAGQTDATITAYLNACCATLNDQLTDGIGYYQFPWEYQDNADVEQKAVDAPEGAEDGILVPVK